MTTVKVNASSGNFASSQNVYVKKTVSLSSISLSFSSSTVYAGSSVTAKVIASYSDGTTKDVTDESTVSAGSNLSVSGSNISSIKAIGCLGNRTVTASYGGKSSSATLTVISDFKSINLTCTLYCEETRNERTGDGNSDMYLAVPTNDGGTITLTLSGTLYTYNGDSYNVISNSFIKVWYENDLLVGGTSTDEMMHGDELTMRIEYLGETVKSWGVSF